MNGEDVHDLLVVAGATGAGKSTFMAMLKEGRLRPALEAALPKGARHWPQFGSKRKDASTIAPDFVLHYTTIVPRLAGLTFDDDPVLQPLRAARRATVLTIRLDPAQAIRQYEARKVANSGARNRFRKAVDAVLGRKEGTYAPAIRKVYREPGWLEARAAEWDAFLRGLASCRELTLVDVIPTTDAGGGPDFELASVHAPTAEQRAAGRALGGERF